MSTARVAAILPTAIILCSQPQIQNVFGEDRGLFMLESSASNRSHSRAKVEVLYTAAMAMGTAFGWRSEADYGSPIGFFACSEGSDFAVVSVSLAQDREVPQRSARGGSFQACGSCSGSGGGYVPWTLYR